MEKFLLRNKQNDFSLKKEEEDEAAEDNVERKQTEQKEVSQQVKKIKWNYLRIKTVGEGKKTK